MKTQDEEIVDDKFQLLATLGTGGFATVYRARQIGFDREVALKVLDSDDIDEASVKRFEREAKILQTFQTKFIPAIYGYGLWDRHPYMAMELVSGVSLANLLARDDSMSFERLKPIVTAVAQGLQYAHSQEVVHRDLSPANIILVNQQGMPDARIIDFGLATFTQYDLRNRQKLTAAGSALGSFHYMSPEQCLAEPADARSDIYSLGCIIYRALTGNVPFDADNPVFLLKMHVNDPFPQLSSEFGEPLQAVINRATAKDREKRYQSAEEFLHDWNKLQASPTGVARSKLPAPSLPLIALAMLLVVCAALFVPQHKPQPVENQNAAELVEKVEKMFWAKNAYQGKAFEEHLAQHLALAEQALKLEEATHQLSPTHLDMLEKNLSWAYRHAGDNDKALMFGRDVVVRSIERSAPCETALGAYIPAMYDATPEQKRDFIYVMQRILDHKPPYNEELKVHARLGMAQAYMRLNEPDAARAIMPRAEEITDPLSRQYAATKEYMAQHFGR